MFPVYQSSQIKKIDQIAAQYLNISLFELMKKAGKAVFNYVQHRQSILVVAGTGNNAGDGFIVALLALKSNINIKVWALMPIEQLPEDAQKAANIYLQAGGTICHEQPSGVYDCIVDAIFGTGLSRDISGIFSEAIQWINQQNITTIAIDLPSGLEADTGCLKSHAIYADITIAIICYKVGLITNHGKDVSGELYLEDLGVSAFCQEKHPSHIHKIDTSILKTQQLKHHHNSHKGSFGQVMIVGGNDSMLGAVILAGRSALRSGCGLVEVVSHSQQNVLISLHCPELLTTHEITQARLKKSADVIAIGPGLGLDQQAKDVLKQCIDQKKAMVIDADALTLIAQHYQFNNKQIRTLEFNDNVVLTPHPKEAAVLLNTTTQIIQNDRIQAALNLSQYYKATVVLKGSGTIICNREGQLYICPYGYSGMATAGMGDVLTGMIASLMAQGLHSFDAATIAVTWHAIAAESCQKGNGLIATDVIENLPVVMS